MTYITKDTNIYTDHTGLTAGKVPLLTVADGELTGGRLELDALVRSGDYHATVATILDGLDLDEPKLDQLVRDLLYVQHHYKIVPRK